MAHNKIQEVCSGDEPSLVMGEIYGLRQWQMHEPAHDPRLVGHRSMTWDLANANQAVCLKKTETVYRTVSLSVADFQNTGLTLDKAIAYYANAFALQHPHAVMIEVSPVGMKSPRTNLILNPKDFGDVLELPEVLSLWVSQTWIENGFWVIDGMPLYPGTTLDLVYSADIAVQPHEVTLPECGCGFYAYTDKESLLANSRDYGDVVFGMVRAFGLVTQGTKGFRAEKAQIVALTRPLNAVNITPPAKKRPLSGPVYYPWLMAPKQTVWVPNLEETIQLGFKHMIPDTISVLDSLEDLLALSEHFIEPVDDD